MWRRANYRVQDCDVIRSRHEIPCRGRKAQACRQHYPNAVGVMSERGGDGNHANKLERQCRSIVVMMLICCGIALGSPCCFTVELRTNRWYSRLEFRRSISRQDYACLIGIKHTICRSLRLLGPLTSRKSAHCPLQRNVIGPNKVSQIQICRSVNLRIC